MIKYIDKGTARQHLTDRLMESALNNAGIKADADEVFRDIAENRLPVWIDELQTYDVQEVRHGRWKPFDLTWGRSVYACTSCGEAFEVPTECGKPMYEFCPYCGAKMDEVEE